MIRFRLKDRVSPHAPVGAEDALAMKRALRELGEYEATDAEISPLADARMLYGMKNFQRKNGLHIDGLAEPGGPTEIVMRSALARRALERAGPRGRHPLPELRLRGGVGRDEENRPGDVAAMKNALAWVEKYPADRARRGDGRLDEDFRRGLDAFQRDYDLIRDGRARPGGQTETHLNRLVTPMVQLASMETVAGDRVSGPARGWPGEGRHGGGSARGIEVAQADAPEEYPDAPSISAEQSDQEPPAPSMDRLRELAPSGNRRRWTEPRYRAQQREIDRTTREARAKNLPNLHDRMPRMPKRGEYLAFDGERFMHVRYGRVVRAWPAVSGEEGYRGREHQGIRDHGPIPEGQWTLRQDRHQSIQDVSIHKRLFNLAGEGPWPGDTTSWGHNRIWVTGPNGEEMPSKLGRDGFAVHGGNSAGSAGCIDLTEFMPDFTAYFQSIGRDLPLFVSYPE